MRVAIVPRFCAKKNKSNEWLIIECASGMTLRHTDSGERLFIGYRKAVAYAESNKWTICTTSVAACQKILDKATTHSHK
jgi:hypothetical protein